MMLLILFPFTAYYGFVVVLFNCLQTFGCYFCYDIPSVLQDQFQGVRLGSCLQAVLISI